MTKNKIEFGNIFRDPQPICLSWFTKLTNEPQQDDLEKRRTNIMSS